MIKHFFISYTFICFPIKGTFWRLVVTHCTFVNWVIFIYVKTNICWRKYPRIGFVHYCTLSIRYKAFHLTKSTRLSQALGYLKNSWLQCDATVFQDETRNNLMEDDIASKINFLLHWNILSNKSNSKEDSFYFTEKVNDIDDIVKFAYNCWSYSDGVW